MTWYHHIHELGPELSLGSVADWIAACAAIIAIIVASRAIGRQIELEKRPFLYCKSASAPTSTKSDLKGYNNHGPLYQFAIKNTGDSLALIDPVESENSKWYLEPGEEKSILLSNSTSDMGGGIISIKYKSIRSKSYTLRINIKIPNFSEITLEDQFEDQSS